MTLLADNDPPPFTVANADGDSDFVIIADHAGRAIPAALGDLGVSDVELERHIAWDIGVAGTSRALADRLNAFVITQSYSRLVIDCNRAPGSPQSIVTRSERTPVPGNEAVSAEAAVQRTREIFDPYHARIRDELDRRQARARRSILIAMHSFTPVYMEDARAWHAGVLYNRDARFAHAVLDGLRTDSTLIVGDNQPYQASEATDYALIVHGERRGLLCVEIEIRQDLIAHERGQAEWAERLAQVLMRARALFPT